jgi:hypothetical protein
MGACSGLTCSNVGVPCYAYDQDDDPLYFCIFHLVEYRYCWCCGIRLKKGSLKKLCVNCYDPDISDEPF